MNPLPLPELLTLLGTFVGSAFALARLVFASHRQTVERFVTFLEAALGRQEAANGAFRLAVADLAESVRDQTRLLARVGEKVGAGA